MGEQSPIDPEWDPCPRRTTTGVPCQRPRHHVGHCGISEEKVAEYRRFIADLRKRAKTMNRGELAEAVEFHLIAWHVLRLEFNAR